MQILSRFVVNILDFVSLLNEMLSSHISDDQKQAEKVTKIYEM